MNELNERFFNTAIQSQNPIFDELMDEYSKSQMESDGLKFDFL